MWSLLGSACLEHLGHAWIARLLCCYLEFSLLRAYSCYVFFLFKCAQRAHTAFSLLFWLSAWGGRLICMHCTNMWFYIIVHVYTIFYVLFLLSLYDFVFYHLLIVKSVLLWYGSTGWPRVLCTICLFHPCALRQPGTLHGFCLLGCASCDM